MDRVVDTTSEEEEEEKRSIHKAGVDTKPRLEWRIKEHTSVIGQWRNSPVSKQICLSFSSWRGNFVPVIAPPSSPKLLLISAFQFPPLCKHWVLTYFRLLPQMRGRSRKDEREGERRWGTAGLLVQSCFRFPQGVGMQIQREKYAQRWCCG